MTLPRILVVDDEEAMRHLYRLEFEEDGYAVTTAADAEQAFAIMDQEPVNVIIMDIKMAGMNGIEALQKLVGRGKQVPVILNSGYAHFKENYITWLADAYVVKLLDLKELKQAVRDALIHSGSRRDRDTLLFRETPAKESSSPP